MICPHCNEELSVPTYAWHNVDAYHSPKRVYTKCCGKMVVITPVKSYNIQKYNGTGTMDDWGNYGG